MNQKYCMDSENGRLDLLLEQLRRGEQLDELFMETLLLEILKLRKEMTVINQNMMVVFGKLIKRSSVNSAIFAAILVLVAIILVISFVQLFPISFAKIILPSLP